MKKILLILSVLILVGTLSTYLWLHNITKKIFIPQAQSAKAQANSVNDYLTQKLPFTILLVGYGGGNHDGPYLTDSIIAAHIDPKTQKIFLISIPRDIWVKIPTNENGGEYSKINAAYSDGLDKTSYPNKPAEFMGQDGAGKLVESVVGTVTGLPIQYFIGMDFSGFTNTINTLGGVDITVQTAFDDYAYPIEGKEDDTCGIPQDAIASFSAQIATSSAQEWDIFPCRFEHLHFNTGKQHMDGATALKYVRSRHSLQDGTDFGRAQRQRNLLVAVKQKVYSAGFIPKIFPFITSLGDDLRTDLSPDDVKTFITNASSLNKYQVVNLALTDQNYLKDTVSSDGQDILESVDGIDNWTSVHNYLSDQFSGKQTPVSAVIQVENGTTVSGLAGLASNRLKDANLQVIDPINSKQKLTQTTIALLSKNINTTDLATIKKQFPKAKITYATQNNETYNVLVIVGSDYNNEVGKKQLNEP